MKRALSGARRAARRNDESALRASPMSSGFMMAALRRGLTSAQAIIPLRCQADASRGSRRTAASRSARMAALSRAGAGGDRGGLLRAGHHRRGGEAGDEEGGYDGAVREGAGRRRGRGGAAACWTRV